MNVNFWRDGSGVQRAGIRPLVSIQTAQGWSGVPRGQDAPTREGCNGRVFSLPFPLRSNELRGTWPSVALGCKNDSGEADFELQGTACLFSAPPAQGKKYSL